MKYLYSKTLEGSKNLYSHEELKNIYVEGMVVEFEHPVFGGLWTCVSESVEWYPELRYRMEIEND